uniref:4Fe-4S ferredoxin-type domain-containing protein n=1 Tax=Oryza brachyantha TaxID=4533 RepID=J3KZ70_ORYBR
MALHHLPLLLLLTAGLANAAQPGDEGATIVLKDGTTCKLCASCDNPCNPSYYPPPTPPVVTPTTPCPPPPSYPSGGGTVIYSGDCWHQAAISAQIVRL